MKRSMRECEDENIFEDFKKLSENVLKGKILDNANDIFSDLKIISRKGSSYKDLVKNDFILFLYFWVRALKRDSSKLESDLKELIVRVQNNSPDQKYFDEVGEKK